MNNGGFDQYFFNSPGDHVSYALVAATRIGADLLADLVSRAMRALGADSYPLDRITRQQRLLELPDGAFEGLDDEFYALEGTVDLDAAMDLLAST